MKNNKIKLIIGIILLLAATTSFAAILECYIEAEGTGQVSPPEFYIGSAEEETLLINEKVEKCVAFGISDEYRTFKTEELGGVNFNYIPKARFSVRAKIEETSTTTPQDLILTFGYYDTSDTNEENPIYLGSKIFVVDNELKDYSSDFIQCGEKPINVKRFFYEFQKDEDCVGCKYSISKCAGGFYTKVELGT